VEQLAVRNLAMHDSWPKIIQRVQTKISPWIELIAREVQFADGSATDTYYAIAQPEYLAAVATTPEGRILLVRQYRPAIERYSLEFPAGLLDQGERPEDAIRRELLEETGYRTTAITFLGRGPTCSSRISNLSHSFFIEAGERVDDFVEEPGIEVVAVTPAELRDLVLSGDFSEQTHLGALSLALLRGCIRL
jgi:ADP-ribose pyrophosphatase